MPSLHIDDEGKESPRSNSTIELRQMEEGYHSLFELAPDSIVLTNVNGVIKAVNSATLSLSGYSKDELVGNHISKLISLKERDIPRLFNIFFSSHHSAPKPFVISLSNKEGTEVWVEAHIGLLDIGSKEPDIQLILRDITDRKRVEDELLFKNTLFEAQSETSPDGILVEDREGNAILFNKRFGKMWGIPPEVLETRSRVQYLWYLLDRVKKPKAFMKKVVSLYEHEDKRSQEEIELKDGRIFDRCSSPLIDSNGKYYGRIWFFRDITERKRYEEKLEALHKHSVELSQTITLDEVAASTLNAIEEIFGFSYLGFGVVEDGLLRFKYGRGESTVTELPLGGPGISVKAVKTGKTQLVPDTRKNEDYVSSRVEGDQETLSELDVPVKLDREVIAVINVENERVNAFNNWDKRLLEILAQHIASAIAIIQQKEKLQISLNELKRSNRELDDYTYVVSHDLKAPLRSITAFSKFLLDDYSNKLDETGKEYLMRIIDASTRMDGLIKDLLVLSRVGRKYTEAEMVDLNELVDQIKLDFEAQPGDSGVEVVVCELPRIRTQKVWMRQLFTNLIVNGLKFNKSPTPRVEVSCVEREGDFLFSVRDNGIGIKEKDQKRLFKLFLRLHTQDEYSGTGAGLAICRKIVESLGGEIWVESRVGEGSTFYFTYPKEPEMKKSMHTPQVEHSDTDVPMENVPVG